MSVIINGKVYRNLQEQVLENTLDIEELKQQYGFKGPYETTASIPSDALLDNAIYLIGTEAPYDLYKFNEISGRFIPLGEFPQPGPQGPQGAPGEDGTDGANGITPHIDSTTGNWFIGNVDTGVHAQGPAGENGTDGTDGTDGITPHIGANGNWFIGDQDTGVHAQGPAGQDGTDGTDGTDGVTPHIDSTTGNWFIGDVDTGVHAQGPQGPQGVGAYTAGTGIDITSDTISIKPDNRFTKSGINEITAGSVNVKTHNYDTYDGTTNLAGLSIMDGTTYTQTMLKPNHNTLMFFTAEQFMQTSINRGEEAPDYTMTFTDANNTGVYTFKRNKSGDVAVTSEIPSIEANPSGTATATLNKLELEGTIYEITGGGPTYTAGSGIDITNNTISVDNTVALKSEIPDTTNMVTTDTSQSIYASKYFRNSNSSAYGNMSYTLLSYTDGSDTSTFSASSASFRNSNNTTGYSTGYGKEQINHRYKTGTSSLYKPFEISFTNETTSEVEGKYTFANNKTGTVAITSEIITSYNDLTDKPTIPAAQVNADWNAVSGVAQILNKPSLATVATSGSYNDLLNKPTIPAAVSGTNDGTNWTTLTIGNDTYAVGGSAPSNMVTTDTFQVITANKTFQYANATINIGISSGGIVSSLYPGNYSTTLDYGKLELSIGTSGSFRSLSITADGLLYSTRNSLDFNLVSWDGLGETGRYTFSRTKTGTVAVTSDIITSYTDLTDKPSIPSTASSSSTSTVTPTTSAFMTSTTKTTETLTFTYSDNTTANITIVTSVTDNTSNAMTGASVSTTTTTTLS